MLVLFCVYSLFEAASMWSHVLKCRIRKLYRKEEQKKNNLHLAKEEKEGCWSWPRDRHRMITKEFGSTMVYLQQNTLFSLHTDVTLNCHAASGERWKQKCAHTHENITKWRFKTVVSTTKTTHQYRQPMEYISPVNLLPLFGCSAQNRHSRRKGRKKGVNCNCVAVQLPLPCFAN